MENEETNEETIKQAERLGQSIADAVTSGYSLLAPRIAELESAAQYQAELAAKRVDFSETLTQAFTTLEERVSRLEALVLSQKQIMDRLAQCVRLHSEVLVKLGVLAAQENGGPFIVRS